MAPICLLKDLLLFLRTLKLLTGCYRSLSITFLIHPGIKRTFRMHGRWFLKWTLLVFYWFWFNGCLHLSSLRLWVIFLLNSWLLLQIVFILRYAFLGLIKHPLLVCKFIFVVSFLLLLYILTNLRWEIVVIYRGCLFESSYYWITTVWCLLFKCRVCLWYYWLFAHGILLS